MSNSKSRNGRANQGSKSRRSVPESIDCELREILLKFTDELTSRSPSEQNHGGHQYPNPIMDVEVDGFTYVLSRLPTAERIRLTERQQQIARLVAEGFPNKTIATRLGISSATVAVHLQRIFRKLNIDSRAALARQTAFLL